MKKLLYLSNSIIPSQYANSVHVMKMCQAFININFDVELLCYTIEKNFSHAEVFDRYGIKSKFKIFPLYFEKIRGRFFQNFFKIFKFIYFYDRNSLIYGRDVYSVFLASLLGYGVMYESHGFPNSKIYSFVENKLLNRKNLIKLVVISKKLKEIYLDKNPSIGDENILVLHDGADKVPENQKSIDFGGGFHVGYIGSLFYKGRGIDVILGVAKLNPDFTFHLVGGKDEEIRYWKSKATKNVNFYGFLYGGIPAKEIQQIKNSKI
jgi:hypothetical protein